MNAPLPDSKPASLRAAIAHRFSLHDDKADDDEIDRSLRSGVELRGATPWILMFAIVIASVGLNINSTAVIIGAMLVSPLMGPIVGIGYGIGIFDFPLIRRSLVNLAIAAGLSLATSTLYFLVTPLADPQSELLARTTPTLWDVLIALAGGMAGIIGQTRRDKSNVIPGVAIATALMPPLCTAGYGLANANWAVFGGAFYLFSINCVFIAFAAVIIIDILRLPHRKFVDPGKERRVKRVLLAIVLVTGLPSIYLAAKLVDNELFSKHARDFVRNEFQDKLTHVIETRIDARKHEIEVTMIGATMPLDAVHAIEKRLDMSDIAPARLIVHQAQDSKIDVGSLKADILAEIFRDSQKALIDRDATIATLHQQLARRQAWLEQSGDVAHEFVAQYPDCADVVVGQVVPLTEAATPASASPASAVVTVRPAQPVQPAAPAPVPLLSAMCGTMPAAADVKRAAAWLQARTKNEMARLVVTGPPPRNARRR